MTPTPSTTTPDPNAAESDDIFALFEWLLAPARLALRARAKNVAFLLVDVGETWLFDPTHDDGPLFRRVAHVAPGILRVTCTVDVLKRLVTDDDFVLNDDDTATFDGDLDDLLALADVLDEQKNALGIRVKK